MEIDAKVTTVIGHHAIALDWLARQLGEVSAVSAERWKLQALSYALREYEAIPPPQLQAILERNLSLLKQASQPPEATNDDLTF